MLLIVFGIETIITKLNTLSVKKMHCTTQNHSLL